jgi:hypothetical protein
VESPDAFGVEDRNRYSLENLVETFPTAFENCRQYRAVLIETAVKSEI